MLINPLSDHNCYTIPYINSPASTSTAITDKSNENLHWTRDHTLILIDCYKMFRDKVGGMKMKSLKKMWEVIAAYIQEKYNIKYNAQHCENRWRVLERNYKKYIENNSKTGRGRRYFEFSKEMDDIFKMKRNIHPEILLSSTGNIKFSKIPKQRIKYVF